MVRLSTIFEQEPYSWGLRGDPFLWEEMKMSIDLFERPKSTEEFEKLLTEMFFKLTGEKIGKGKQVFVERFSKGGMSSGFCDSDYWSKKAFKLLEERFVKIQNV